MAKHRITFSRNSDIYAARIKIIIFGALFSCVLCALESTWFSAVRLPLFGYSSPLLCLGLALAAGFLIGEREGGAVGLFSGFLCECADGDWIFIYPLLFFIFGYLTGILTDLILGKNLPSYLVFMWVSSLAVCAVDILTQTVTEGGVPSGAFAAIFAGALLSVVFSIPTYLLIKLYAKFSNKK